MIRIQSISKKYGVHYAVKDVSLTVDQGDAVGILGRSGAGKTTIMDIISGYVSPTDGAVSVNGFNIQKNPREARRKIGYLPQHPPLYQEMTVTEYLRFACALKSVPVPQISEDVSRVMESAHITGISKRRVGNLSKAYKQKVGLAGALCGNPDVLLLDEPTAGLDPGEIAEIRSLIKAIRREHTVILSSRMLHEVAEICEKIVIVNKGVIVAQDSLANLTANVNHKCRVSVRLVASRKDAENLLKKIDGIDFAEYAGCKEPDTCDFVVETCERDVRADIFKLAAEAGIVLLGLKPMSVTLEDIFIQLTCENEEAVM